MVREKIKYLLREELSKNNKSQSNFDWHNHYPDYLKADLEIVDDNVKLYHFGTTNKTNFLDPEKAFKNKNPYTPDSNQWSKPRIFFYVHEKDKEWRVQGDKFTVLYPLNKLYPFSSDPFNFYNDCIGDMIYNYNNMKDLPISTQIQCIGDKVIGAGFDGLIFRWSGSYRVDIWKSILVRS